MKAIVALLFSALALCAAQQSDMAQRIPLKLAHLSELKQKDPQKMFHVRTPAANDVVAQISKVVLDADGKGPKFAVLLLFENVSQNRPAIVVPWEALSISTNRDEIFLQADLNKLGLALAIFAVAMVMRRLARPRRER